jgi:molybdopterin-containing oxidoreductase family iron-sulfur binding subunit
MDQPRRTFLRRSLVVLGAGAAGGALKQICAAAAGSPSAATTPSDPNATCSVCATAPSLTADHQLLNAAPAGIDASRRGVPGRKWIMVIDLARCDGCGHCTSACSKMHFTPPNRQYIKVLRMREGEDTAPYFFPQPCYHCDNPPCTKVCPVDATYKRTDGIVLVDNERCIGCRFCMAACPYGARSFNWARPAAAGEDASAASHGYSPETGYPRRVGTVEKCDFCPDMAAQGQLPACVKSCPMGVVYYGDENEDAVTNGLGQTVRLSTFLRDNAGYRHMEELGTEPRVYYLPPKNRMYPAPGEEVSGHA